MRQDNDHVESNEKTVSAVDVQDAAQIAKEFGHAVLWAKLSADQFVGLKSTIESLADSSKLVLVYRSSTGTPMLRLRVTAEGVVTQPSLIKGFLNGASERITAALKAAFVASCQSALRPPMVAPDAPPPVEVETRDEPPAEVIVEWTQLLDSPPPIDLLEELRELVADYKEDFDYYNDGGLDWLDEPIREDSFCCPDTVHQCLYSDGEDTVATWMMRNGYDIRESELDDRVWQWSVAVVDQVIDSVMQSSKPSKCDENEAVFHEMEPDMLPNSSDGIFLTDWFSKKLDSALAAIPEPLRNFLDALTDAYELDDFDSVLEYAHEEGMCGDGCSDEDGDGEEADRFTEVEIERAWEFIKNYRDSIDLLDAANEAANILLNPAVGEVQQCN